MYRTIPYIGLFAAAVLLQVFLFDNLSISVYLNPLVYIIFIILLPFDAQPVTLLGAGVLLGLTMDLAMGTAGINTAATLPVAMLRPTLCGVLCGRENVREGGIPSPGRLGSRKFFGYLLTLTLIHHTIFFLLEALSWRLLGHTVLRIVISSAVTVAFGWIITRIFTAKLPARV
ncbi:rod shape-determining protein MreD [uncultured Alistipes sp.]|uniref:rod shape-determining protein MreD n=1 Tax=uncultured Alistipes sp. TaxID=538949 RepID=UPI00280392ED|nr:rod shape-determining protein MreD [uncultured Alistipes sp.]